MMNEQQQALIHWLTGLLGETRRLYAVLDQERAALGEQRIDALIQLSGDKNAAVMRIDALVAQLPGGEVPREELIGRLLRALQLEGHEETRRLWREVQRLIARCRALNEANGAAIALLQEHNRRALELLFGGSRQRVCYDAGGQSQAEAGERLLGTS